MTRLRTVSLCFFLIVIPASAWAQDVDPGFQAEIPLIPGQSSEAETLLEQIRQNDGEMMALMDQLENAEGEDLYILRSRVSDLAGQQRSDLTALIAVMTDSLAAANDITLVEQQGEQLLRRSSRHLRNYIQLFQTALEREGLRRPLLTAGEAQLFEHRMAEDTNRLNGFYLSLVQLTNQMAGLGLSTDDETAFLEMELSRRGENLLQLVSLTESRLGELRAFLQSSSGDPDTQAWAFATEERYESNKASLLATIHQMKTLGMDIIDLEVRAVEVTGEITPEALQVEVAVGLVTREVQRAKTYLAENGPGIILRFLVILGILLVSWVLARLTREFTQHVLNRTKIARSALLRDMVVSLAGRLVLIFGVLVALAQMGINLGPVLAGLGIVGFIVGFALQDTLANFAAGTMILAYQPFDVGDFVEAAGVSGKVKDMNLVSTRILTTDHQTLIVPNGKIWGDVIRNVTAQTTRRVDMVFGISYEDEIPKAERLLREIIDSHESVLEDPEPVIKLHTLNDSSVDFVVRPWVRTEDYWDVYWDITREVKMTFDREGISIPYPQRDVHLISQGEPEPAS